MERTQKLGWFFVILGILILAIPFLYLDRGEGIEEEVDCYDKNNNKIIGVKCIDNANYENVGKAIAFLVVGVLLLVSGFAMTTMDSYGRKF